MFQKLDAVESHYQDIERRLSSPEVVGNQNLFQKLSIEHASLSELVSTYKEYRKLKDEFDSNAAIIRDDSGELKEMARLAAVTIAEDQA